MQKTDPEGALPDRLFARVSYGGTAFAALAALVPFLFAEGAISLIAPSISGGLGTGKDAVSLASYLGTGAYAFGALMGGDLVRRFPQRSLFLAVQALSTLGWAILSASHGVWLFALAQILVGFAGGALLVIALPPLLQKFPAGKIPTSAFLVNFGLFGAVAAGPLIGGVVAMAEGAGWRWFFALFSVTGSIALLAAARHLPGGPPKEPDRSVDWTAIGLTLAATLLPFTAIGLIPYQGLLSPAVLLLLVTGLGCFCAFVVNQYVAREPLAPIDEALNTFSLMGLIVATIGGGVFVTCVSLLTTLRKGQEGGVLELGLSFWPQLLGVVVAAGLFAAVIRTRMLLPFVLSGLAAILAGPLLLTFGGLTDDGLFALSIFVIGYGAGATVSPGLLFSAVSMPVKLLAGVIAMIELSRAIGNFLAAPILIDASRIAHASASLEMPGAQLALTVLLAITSAGVLAALLLYVTGRRGLVRAEFEPWIANGKPAFDSPRLFARLRK
ncbi:MFS transporter [Fulvimarina endophytica]|uniref:MFS transporter n=1 Tax=Fulvimarina endophytica TaxID=2293836 RepID=A0A371X0M8_9HYPH|nr:MFS transporter [Fulvimarina endophytica]RFC62584.1 MFS transporter [Fulvimarina endophytica]